MIQAKEDRYSPNYLGATMILTLLCIILLCGQSLWVPASRIENLYLRSVVLAATDAASALSSSVGLDRFIPEWRESFIRTSGLSHHASWDTRYYHKRAPEEEPEQAAPAAPAAPEVREPSAVPPVDGNASPLPGAAIPEAVVMQAVPGFSSPASALSAAPSGLTAGGISHSREHPLKVYFFGDSQVFSLGSGLSRLAGKDSPVSVDFLAIHSSGFVRGDYYNWNAKLQDVLKDGSCEAAVMMLGMNDYQSFWNNRGEIMKKGTTEWEAAYKEKCRRIIDVVLASVPKLYWVGMPAVKNSVYNSSLEYIDSVQQSLASEYSPDLLVRVPLKDAIPGPGKAFTEVIERPGSAPLRVMQEDGSHFTVEGGQLAMKPLYDRLSRDFLFSEVPVAHLPE